MSAEAAPALPSVDGALVAFLELRDSDMQVWRRASAHLNLSSPAALAIAMVLRADLRGAPLRQVDLRRALHMSPAGVSALVDELEERRLLQRTRMASDRRAFLLRAGEDASPLLAKLRHADEGVVSLLQQFTPEQVEAITTLLQGVRALRDGEFVSGGRAR